MKSSVYHVPLDLPPFGLLGLGAAQPGPLITCPTLVARAKQLDDELELERGHGIAQVTLEAMLGDVLAGDYERILCGWSFTKGEAWAEGVLSRLRRQWAQEDAQCSRHASKPPAASPSPPPAPA